MPKTIRQILAAPVDAITTKPVFRVAHYNWDNAVEIYPVVAWAIVAYEKTETRDAEDTVEPVYVSEGGLEMTVVAETEFWDDGEVRDVLLAPGVTVTGLTWLEGAPHPRGRIETTQDSVTHSWGIQAYIPVEAPPEREPKPKV